MKKILIALCALLFLIPSFAFAIETKKPDDSGNLNIEKSSNPRNLYSFASNLTIDSVVYGDLVVGGNIVDVNNTVEQSAFIAGSTINLKGNVGQNARVFGNVITISGIVYGDLIVAGNSIVISDSTQIYGDLFVAGSAVSSFPNLVKGKTDIRGSIVKIDGNYQDNVNIKASKSLTLKSTAILEKDLVYKSPNNLVAENGSKIKGQTFYTPMPKNDWKANWNQIALQSKVLSIIMVLVVGLILVYLLPKKSLSLSEIVGNHFWKSLGIGFLALILPVIAMFVLFATFVGALAGLILLVFYIVALSLSAIYGGIILGSLITKWINKQKGFTMGWKEVVIGVLIAALLSYIPVVGGAIGFFLFLIALGSITVLAGKTLKAERS